MKYPKYAEFPKKNHYIYVSIIILYFDYETR